MKKVFYIIAAVAIAAAAFSCQKPDDKDALEQNGENLVTLTAVFPSDVATRVSLDQEGKTGWEIGDVITIHGKKTSELKTVTLDGTTNTISDDKKRATFTVALDMTPDDNGAEGFFAAYPHSAFAEYESDRTRYFNCFNNTNTLLLSGVIIDSEVVFYNVTGALSFTVDGSTFGGFDEYMVAGKNEETVGFDHFNTRVATGYKAFCHYSSSGEKKAVRGAVTDDGSTVNYVFFPATQTSDTKDVLGKRAKCVDFTNGFIIYFLKEGVITHMVSCSNQVTIERQSLTKLGDITSHVKTYSPPASHNSSIPANSATDLGSSETANCYVVDGSNAANAEKIFKFKAVKGNGADVLSDISSVEILWETYNDDSEVVPNSVIGGVDFDLQEGGDPYVVFQMPAELHTGNAVIAAKNMSNDIIWSWHIWVPSVACSSADYTSFIGGYMMNMNLGAIEPVPASGPATIACLGLLYQWGRKDPFTSTYRFASDPKKATVTPAVAAWSKSLETVTVDDAIKTPTVYYYPQGDDKDWNSSPNAKLWDNDGKKTIYDPCPAGYRVPVKSGSIWTKSDDGWDFDVTNHVCVYTANGVRIPMAGYIEAWGGALYGTQTGTEHTYLWSATHHDTERGECMYIRTSRDPGSKYYKAYRGKANAGSVRCVAIPAE